MAGFSEDWLRGHQARVGRIRASAPGGPCVGGRIVSPPPAPAKAKRAQPEEDLQKAVADLLDWGLPAEHRWLHIPNGGHRHWAVAAKLKAQGVKAGAADVLVFKPDGTFVWIELKSDAGVLTEGQEDWRDWCLRIGRPWALCRSVADVVAALEDAGVKLRVRA